MKTSYDILKTLLRTEKGAMIEKDRQYIFRVATPATKTEIKKAVEEIYKVKVQAVNVTNVPGKRKRVRMQYGYKSDWKKAVVTLKEGSKIEVA
ncbi:MAG: 50S ribosomal protein L23 [Candidatus Omnitrophica bacterium]|nr:50S ribosomal protein L23 [Candidatus Omnitrophota bacterium]